MNTNINENVINTRRNNRIIKHNDAVYKVFNEGYSKEDVFAEAFFTSKIEGLTVNGLLCILTFMVNHFTLL